MLGWDGWDGWGIGGFGMMDVWLDITGGPQSGQAGLALVGEPSISLPHIQMMLGFT